MTVPVEPIATEERGAVRQNRRNRNVAIPDTPAIAHAPTEMRADTTIIDTDIHVYFSSQDVLRSYLGARWQDYHQMYGARGYHGSHYPRAMPNAARHDAWPDDGTPPGSNLPLLQAQLLDRWGIEIGILNPLVGAGEQRNLEFGAAFARATNEWQLREWLEREPRLRASIVVPWEDGELAAAEIDRWGGHPGFVHALLIARTKEPLGRRKYWPIYEAASRHDVPVAVHFGGRGRRAHNRIGIPVPLHRRSWRHAAVLPGPGDQPDLRGRLPAVPDAEFRPDRRGLWLDSADVVADGQRLAHAGQRSAPS